MEKSTTERCPVYKKCGGCQLDTAYPEQLRFKQRKVERLLRRFGKVAPIIGMDKPCHYRNKVQAAFYTNRSGRIISGVYQSGTHHVVGIDKAAAVLQADYLQRGHRQRFSAPRAR